MSDPHGIRTSTWLAALMVASLMTFHTTAMSVTITLPAGEPTTPAPHVHFAIGLARCRPQLWPDVTEGYSMMGRVAIDPSPRWSGFADAQMTRLTGTGVDWVYYPQPHPSRHRVERSIVAVGIGARMSLLPLAPARPYVEAGVEGRFTDDLGGTTGAATSGRTRTDVLVQDEGLCGLVRAGVTTARWKRAGVFADVGWEFVLRNADQRGVVPVRLGIELP